MAIESSASKLNCRKCTNELKGFRGCNGKPEQPFIFQGKDLDRCPLKLITPESFWLIKLHNYFEQGFLPFEGSILRQPAKILEAFDIIDREKQRIKDARRK